MNKPIRFLKAILNLVRKSTWGPFTEVSEISHFDHAFSVSWAQGGEDLALLHALKGLKQGRYIDVGAHHPSRFSVTRHLYQMGWSGINIDANQELIENFKRSRPRDTNLCLAVGPEQRYEFTIFEEPAISTLDKEWRQKFLNEQNKIVRIVEVEGRSLRKILDDFESEKRLELLAIDAEGSDLQVLQSLDLSSLEEKRFPQWLLLEASPPVSNALDTPAVAYAMDWGYEPHMILAMSTLLRFKEC